MVLKSLHPHHLLSWMAIPTYPRAYILGSFARHVTIYSQQMRAFNLVDALCKTGQLSDGVSVAVVGGGIAGLTAAAASAVRGAVVTVIERDEDFFPIQRNAGDRYLHPHIYDWPLYEPKDEQGGIADFPLLSWQAGEAEVVFKALKKSWENFCGKCKGIPRPTELMGTEFMGLVHNSDHDYLELEIQKKDQPAPTLLKTKIAILALGFGREFERSDIHKYWDEAPFDSVPKKTMKWLVSGYGDGALTDLMRLCIKDFRHDEFVEKFANNSGLIQQLKELLVDHKDNTVRDTFEKLSQQLDETSLIVNKSLRSNTDVTFNAPEGYLESTGSSILNRFIIFQLEKLGKFKRQDGSMKLPIPQANTADEYEIEFIDENENVVNTNVFNRLIVRHGPEPPYRHGPEPPDGENGLSKIWKATEELRARWKRQSQNSDRTRVQIWDPGDYDLKKAPNPFMIENNSGGDEDLRCFILESTNIRKQGPLVALIKAGLKSVKIKRALGRKKDDPDIKVTFEVVKINEALSGQKEYNHVVRELCQADIAIIDVTEYEPGVMLFLGIRSAVRRAVTLVTTNNALDSSEWSKLPFNLKELYPLSLFPRVNDINSPEHPTNIIGDTVARALNQSRSLSFYQDLPAYEAVRRFEPPPKHEFQSILWLCPFSEEYAPCEVYIQNGFSAEYGKETTKDDNKKYRLERIIEVVSPQLVTQRLYSAIRRIGLCLIDWSLWRPNVFFEFGVRVAVSSMGPVCLLAKGLKDFADNNDKVSEEVVRQREALKKLFNPIEYGMEDEEQKLFQDIMERHMDMQNYETPGRTSYPVAPTFGAFPYDHIYRLVGKYLPLHDEPVASTVHTFLETSADSLIGTASDPSLPVLYANVNDPLDRQVRDAAKEFLIAAWYYLSRRYSINEMKQRDDLLKQYTDLSVRLSNLLKLSNDAKDGRLRRKVGRVLNRL